MDTENKEYKWSPVDPLLSKLTLAELKVLYYILPGMTNQQIADALKLSERTIESHVSSILSKLEVKTRTAAVTYANHHNFLGALEYKLIIRTNSKSANRKG
jgi:DNA-binding NarL/FixJ family response regulator